jgi:hypothetical protein
VGFEARVFTFVHAIKKGIDLTLEDGKDGVMIEVSIRNQKLVTQFDFIWRDVAEKTAP